MTRPAAEASMVSTIMPVYNGACYLAEAIESMLAQSYRPLEIIVVDDGSTDGSADVAKGYGSEVRYRFQPHGGIALARNLAISMARGRFLAFLDSDDIWEENVLAAQIATFQENPELDMVFGHAREFISPELAVEVASRIVIHAEPMPSMGPGAIIKTEAFRQVGPLQAHWRVGEFMDWHLRAMERGLKSVMLPKVVVRRRLHTANQGVRWRDSRLDYVRILKASLDRRRSTDGPHRTS